MAFQDIFKVLHGALPLTTIAGYRRLLLLALELVRLARVPAVPQVLLDVVKLIQQVLVNGLFLTAGAISHVILLIVLVFFVRAAHLSLLRARDGMVTHALTRLFR